VGGRLHGQAGARGVDGEVRRPDHPVRAAEVRRDLHAPPGVVAKRDDVCAGGEDLVRELRSQSRAVGGVLAVDDAEVGAELLLEAREPLLHRVPSGWTEDVGDEEDPQGIESVAAGYTEITTPFPASVVKRASACCSSLARSATVPILEV